MAESSSSGIHGRKRESMDFMRWLRRVGVLAEDRNKLWLMAPVFLLCGIAEVLTYNGFMTLFNLRFGSEYLPYVYAGEAVVLPLEVWFMGWLAARLSKPGLMKAMYAVMVAIVVANAAVLLGLRVTGGDLRAYYPVLFLSSSFVVRQQTILLWSLAVDLCPTDQAKRLMPLFVSSATLGGVIAGLLTQALNLILGPDVVYIVGPLFLLTASFNYRKSINRYLVPLMLRDSAGEEEMASGLSSWDYFKQTLRSPFLFGVLGLMTIMPALYFLVEYVFMNTAHAAYASEAEFGRMFGVVTTVLFALAFLLQTISGKLMAWFGASGLITVISCVYVVSFAAAWAMLDSPAAFAAVSGGYMLCYLLIYYSAEPSFQIFYKTLSIRLRDGFRYTAQGVSAFMGIVLGAGLQALHTLLGVSLAGLLAIGAAGALAMIGLSLLVRQAYMRELLRSMRSRGMEEREYEEAAMKLMRGSRMRGELLAMLKQPSDEAKEVALRVLARIKDARFLSELLELLGHPNPRIRHAALLAMELSGGNLQDLTRVASVLEDSEPEVRAAAVRGLAKMGHLPSQAFFFLRMKLLDPHPAVVAEAVKSMFALGSPASIEAAYEAMDRIFEDGGEPAVHMCAVVAELKLDRFSDRIRMLLEAAEPALRVAATRTTGLLGLADTVPGMLRRLPTADQELHRATTQAIALMGEQVVTLVQDRMKSASPKEWQACVIALSELLPEAEARGWLAEEAAGKLAEIKQSERLEGAFRALEQPELAELAALRRMDNKASVHEAVWAVLERLTDERVVGSIRRSLDVGDDEARGGALEVLAEGAGERKLSQRFALSLQSDAAPEINLSKEEALAALREAATSSDDWYREMAQAAGGDTERGAGRKSMEEQGLIGRLNRVVYLKKVLFFADLSLEELGLIADVAEERSFEDGALLLERGKVNDALYVVIEGNVELTSVSAAGWEGTLGVLAAGEVCGATSALDETPSTVTAQAFFGEVRALALRRSDINRLVRLYPEIGIGLLRASLARVRLLEEMMMKIDS
ncbi:MAG: HEAT repeat domain-containing protein [Cohnella sp.]|nr:HEAT repeat domain-containing protein [Cohnella sp.]